MSMFKMLDVSYNVLLEVPASYKVLSCYIVQKQ